MQLTHSPHPDEMVTTKELQKLTKLTIRFWEARRISGDSPPYLRISARAVRYRWGDVKQWLEARIRTSTSDQGSSK